MESVIELVATRDSVSMGDDMDAPHKRTFYQDSAKRTKDLITDVISDYLPKINGIGHHWECYLNETLIAIIYHDRIAIEVQQPIYLKHNTIFLKYFSATF